jgi:hypothetical protein
MFLLQTWSNVDSDFEQRTVDGVQNTVILFLELKSVAVYNYYFSHRLCIIRL